MRPAEPLPLAQTVHTLKAGEGFLPFVLDELPRWTALRRLHLSGAGLTSLPEALLSGLPRLAELHVDHNRLAALPPLHAVAASLRVLCADHNALTALPPGLAACTRLRSLTLEANRLERPIVDLRPLGGSLEEFRLGGNALDYLPEMSHCTRLRTLSLANARITADAALHRVDVAECGDGTPAGGDDGGNADGGSLSAARESTAALLGRAPAAKRDFSALYALIFRYSSCQLPLLACAVARLAAESAEQAEAIAAAEGGVQQLLSMVLSENPVVVSAACRTLAALAEQPPLAAKLFDARAVARMLALLRRGGPPAARCSALRVLAALAWASGGVAAAHLAAPELLGALRAACRSRSEAVRRCALRALGNVALTPPAARALLAAPGLRALLARIATGAPPDHGDVSDDDDAPQDAPRPPRARPSAAVRRRATRALAILGENELVAAAVGRPFVLAPRRGLRILAMDGGGMRGLATVRMLRRLEALTGRRVADLFDMICGTSTGGVLAVALGVHCQELDVCEALYRHLGAAVFAPRGGGGRDESGFAQRLTQLYSSTSSRVRVAVSGCKHDAERFERMVRDTAAFPVPAVAAGSDSDEEAEPALIDTATLGGPAVFTVATLMTVTPCVPFIFRNYTHPSLDGSGAEAGDTPLPEPGDGGMPRTPQLGSCKHRLWHALRASSAAPYYLADFAHGGLRWQDGAVVANNPALLALSEASARWPGVPVDVLVSLGSGGTPPRPRDASAISRYIDAGAVLVEAACDVYRADDALALLAPAAGVHYHRFNPVDERCNVEMDELEESLLGGLQAATDEYCDREAARFDACAQQLLRGVAGGAGPRQEGPPRLARRPEPAVPPSLVEPTAAVKARNAAARAAAQAGQTPPMQAQPEAVAASPELAAAAPMPLIGGGARRRLGAAAEARGVLVLDAPRAAAGTPCAAFESFDAAAPSPHAAAIAAVASRAGRTAEPRDTCAEGLSAPEACGLLAAALRRCSHVHFAARCDARGLALGWRRDVAAVAEPGDAAAAFLADVSPHWAAPDSDAACMRDAPQPAPPASLRALCAAGCAFEARGGLLHAPMGETASHAGVPGGGRVFSALFALVPPSATLSADDVYGSLPGAPRGATYSFAHPPPLALAAALLDVGAAAVLAPALFTVASPAAGASPPRGPASASASPATPQRNAATSAVPPPPPPSETALLRFFDAFYAALLGARRAGSASASDDGESDGDDCGGAADVADAAERAAVALGAASALEPGVGERFRVLTLRGGELVALRGCAVPPAPAERLRHPASAAEASFAAAASGSAPFSPQLLLSPRASEALQPPPWASPARAASFRQQQQAQQQQAPPVAAAPPPSPARSSVTGAAWAALGLGSPDGTSSGSSWWPSSAASTPPRR